MNSKNVPARRAEEVTPSDSGAIGPSRAVWVGAGGDIKVDMQDFGTAVTFKSIASGTLLPICVTRIYSTGTTASDLVIVY